MSTKPGIFALYPLKDQFCHIEHVLRTRCKWCASLCLHCCKSTAPSNSHLQRTVHRWICPLLPYRLLPHAKSADIHQCCIYLLIFKENKTLSSWLLYLNFPRAIINHAILGSHGGVVVEFGWVEGNLLHLGNTTYCVGLPWACDIPFKPFEEELLKHGGLTPCWHYEDLHMT